MKHVTLMVRPTINIDNQGMAQAGLYQFLLEKNGYWREVALPSETRPEHIVNLQQQSAQKLKRLMGIIDKHPDAMINPRLKALGRMLYQYLVPPDIKEALEKAAQTAGAGKSPILCIHLDSEVEWIPWEIMHDKADFLGVRFQIARLPILPKGPDLSERQPRIVRKIYNILGQDLLKDDNRVKWQSTFSALRKGRASVQEHSFPSVDKNDYPNLSTLENALDPDILHFTCHGGMYDESQGGQLYWTLSHRASVPEEYRIDNMIVESLGQSLSLRANKPLVFGNACASANSANMGVELLSLGGFGSNFFAQGALAFIGTFAPITATLAVEFAGHFYKRLLSDGMSVGEALRATKKHYYEQGRSDPCYLFYCLYGPPDTCFALPQN